LPLSVDNFGGDTIITPEMGRFLLASLDEKTQKLASLSRFLGTSPCES
jgi:hypothetical protein